MKVSTELRFADTLLRCYLFDISAMNQESFPILSHAESEVPSPAGGTSARSPDRVSNKPMEPSDPGFAEAAPSCRCRLLPSTRALSSVPFMPFAVPL